MSLIEWKTCEKDNYSIYLLWGTSLVVWLHVVNLIGVGELRRVTERSMVLS